MDLISVETFNPFLAADLIVLALIQSVLVLLLIRFLDLYEREPLSLLAFMFVWGAVGATALSLVSNEAVSGLLQSVSPEVETVLGGAIYAPLVEETAKGIALVVVFVLSRPIARRFGIRMFNGVTNGIVYGAAVGLGFSFAEDIFYLFMSAADGDLVMGQNLYLLRAYVLGPAEGQLGHAAFTGAFGAGLGLAAWSRGWAGRIFFPLLGLGIGMLMHSISNGALLLVPILVFGLDNVAELFMAAAATQSEEELLEIFPETLVTAVNIESLLGILLGYVFAAGLFLAMGLWLRYQRRVIREELAEEMEAGLISQEEREIVPRYWYRLLWYWRLLWLGKVERWRALRRLHNELAGLALLKRRLKRTGGDWDQVERLRQRIETFKSQEVVELVDDEADSTAELP